MVVNVYNYFYSYILHLKKFIWNGTTQSYNKKQFDCNNAGDKKLIKQFKIQLMNGLKSQG